MTTITITDPVLLKQIAEASLPIIFHDPSGNELLYAEGFIWKPPPGMKSPISDEELDRRRKNLSGRPLKDVIRELEEKYGK
jgi:hypothetical protein